MGHHHLLLLLGRWQWWGRLLCHQPQLDLRQADPTMATPGLRRGYPPTVPQLAWCVDMRWPPWYLLHPQLQQHWERRPRRTPKETARADWWLHRHHRKHPRWPGEQQELVPLLILEQDPVPGYFSQWTPLPRWRILQYESRSRELLPRETTQEEVHHIAEEDGETEAQGGIRWKQQQGSGPACYKQASSRPRWREDGGAPLHVKVRLSILPGVDSSIINPMCL